MSQLSFKARQDFKAVDRISRVGCFSFDSPDSVGGQFIKAGEIIESGEVFDYLHGYFESLRIRNTSGALVFANDLDGAFEVIESG